MSRSILHIAVFTAMALAAPMIAGTANAGEYRGGPVLELRWGVENVHDRRGYRHHHRAHRHHNRGHWDDRRGYRNRPHHAEYGVSPRRIVRKLRKRGAYDISPVWRKRDTLRVEATNRRGMRARYVFDAYTGQLLRKRPLGWAAPHGRRTEFVIRGYR